MNKRIKDLAEQAKQYAEYVTPQGLEWLPVYNEHFARLIIQDMLSNVFDEVQYSTSVGIANEIDEKLKTIYGIEK